MADVFDNQYILVVDDDPTMQLVLQGMIEKAGFKPVIAENGDKALQFVELGGENVGVVLLDRHMPDMDGFDVVNKLMTLESAAQIPVIMQSGSKTPDDIKEAIDAGIFYYLTKPFKIEALQSVLNFAIEEAEMRSAVREHVEQGFTPANLMQSASFEFQTIEEAKSMAVMLACFFPDPDLVFPGLHALLGNAVLHGSYGVGFDAMSDIIDAAEYRHMIAQLAADDANADKKIEVQFVHRDARYSVRVTDQGVGFDWASWIKFDTAYESFTHGYGILKALNSFDEVKYNTAGNQVMVSVFEK